MFKKLKKLFTKTDVKVAATSAKPLTEQLHDLWRTENRDLEGLIADQARADEIENILVDRNIKGKELEKSGDINGAIELYELNVTDRFDGSHPYERLRRIYFGTGDYANVSRVCRAYIAFGQQDPALKREYQQQVDGIDRFLSADINRELGNASPICPHCGGALLRMPTKKQKCASCRKDVYVRTRPSDRKSVVVTPEQAEILDEQWAMVKGRYDELQRDKQRRSQARALLAEKFGRAPSEGDVEWKLLNEDLLTAAGEQDWPRYRDTRYAMARLLSREKKYKHASITFLEVCYLDINGPINVKDDRWRGVSEPFGPWTPKFGRLNSRVVERIAKTTHAANFTSEITHAQFMERATTVKQALHLPVAVDTAWEQLSNALKELARRGQVG